MSLSTTPWKVNQDLYISVLQPTKRGTWMRGERKRFYQPGASWAWGCISRWDCWCMIMIVYAMYLSDLYSIPSTNGMNSWICTKWVLKQYLKGKNAHAQLAKRTSDQLDSWKWMEMIVLIFEELRISHLNDAYFSCFPYSIWWFFIWIPMFMIPENR